MKQKEQQDKLKLLTLIKSMTPLQAQVLQFVINSDQFKEIDKSAISTNEDSIQLDLLELSSNKIKFLVDFFEDHEKFLTYRQAMEEAEPPFRLPQEPDDFDVHPIDESFKVA